MPSALEGFLKLECDDQLAGWLRAEVEAAQGAGYDHFEFNLFDLELFYAENRVAIVEAAALGYEDAELTLSEFLTAIPDVPAGPRMPGRPRQLIILPPPSAEQLVRSPRGQFPNTGACCHPRPWRRFPSVWWKAAAHDR